MARYHSDIKSLFVANLPDGCTEATIHELFDQYGHIEDIMIREGPSKFDRELFPSCFLIPL